MVGFLLVVEFVFIGGVVNLFRVCWCVRCLLNKCLVGEELIFLGWIVCGWVCREVLLFVDLDIGGRVWMIFVGDKGRELLGNN